MEAKHKSREEDNEQRNHENNITEEYTQYGNYDVQYNVRRYDGIKFGTLCLVSYLCHQPGTEYNTQTTTARPEVAGPITYIVPPSSMRRARVRRGARRDLPSLGRFGKGRTGNIFLIAGCGSLNVVRRRI